MAGMNAFVFSGQRLGRQLALATLVAVSVGTAQAGLFEDDEARKAILELRQRVDTQRETLERRLADEQRRNAEEVGVLRKSLLDLQSQIDGLRAEQASLRGQNEQLVRDLTEVQRRQKDIAQGVDERLRKFEPLKVQVDGREFQADPAEKRDFDAALAVFRQGDFDRAQSVFSDFLRRYAQSGYGPSVLFWLGNAQYAMRDYKSAVTQFKLLLSVAPDHARAPEGMLSLANCQIELKDSRAARKTLEDLLKTYPQAEAAAVAKERLQKLK